MRLRAAAFGLMTLVLSAALQADEGGDRLLDAQAISIPVPSDLRVEAAAARERTLPLLVMFGSEECAYCDLVERQFLKPMVYSGEYRDRILIRRVVFDDSAITDFEGRATTGRELGRRYGIKVTPTVVFLDARGEQVAQKMVGVTTPDYYGGYLDEAIAAALGRVRQGTALAAR